MNRERKHIAIIGVGLIGGSLALRLHEKKISWHITGVEENQQHAREALELELVDEIATLDKALEKADIIALCIPVNAALKLLPVILDRISHRQLVFDMGSTKLQLLNAVRHHPNRGRFVATHPMWGTEYSGPAAALQGAFSNKAVIICDGHESDPAALGWVRYMYNKIGMHMIEMEAGAHDLHTAYISHISHITSFALANTVLQKEQQEATIFELASSGFESTVRLAKSNADMWVPIFQQNKLNVLDVLNEHIGQLEKFRQCIEAEDYQKLRQLIEHANTIKKVIK